MVQLSHTSVLRRRTLRTLTSVLLMMALALGITPTGVSAAGSSWSPTLLVNTEAFQQIDSGNGTSNIELRFGSSTQTIKFLYNATASLRKFQFSHAISVLGTISGSSLNVDRNATVGGTLTVTGAITGVNSITAKTVLSGNTLFISNSAQVRGTLSASGTVAIEGHLTGATIAGFGLGSCNGAGQKLVYNSGTGKFECGTDNNSGTFSSGNVITVSDLRYVKKSGDTMTGALIVKSSISGSSLRISGGGVDIQGAGPLSVTGAIRTATGLYLSVKNPAADSILSFGNTSGAQTLKFLNVRQVFQFSKGISVLGTISGSALRVDNNATIGGTLSASGTVALEGHLTGATIAGFGLGSCNGANQSLQWNSATNKFECTTITTTVGNSSGGLLSLHPTYPNAIYFGSGTTTVGQLSASGSISLNENFYHWKTTQAGIQDYWISARVRLPDNFSTWDPIKPIQLRYRTNDNDPTKNHVTMRIRDTGGTERALTGAAGITSTTFATANITGPEAVGTWTPKGYITVYIKLASESGNFAEVGYLNLNFETTTP